MADLPDRVAVAIEELPAAPEPVPEPVKPDASVEELFAKLSAIKKTIFRLHAVFAQFHSARMRPLRRINTSRSSGILQPS